jgi:4-amino-4-deoxy-L-arabinose transferase-like glycosyltransferase
VGAGVEQSGQRHPPANKTGLNFRRLLQVVLFVGAISLVFLSVHSPRFYDPEGVLQGNFALPFSGGIALFFLSIYPSRFGLWMAVGLVGQAALLQTIDAGKRLRYQHYRPLDASPVALWLLGMQTIAVAAGLWKHRFVAGIWIRKHIKLLGIASFFLITVSTAVSENVSFYFGEVLFAFFASAVQIGNLFLMVREVRPAFFLRSFHRFVSGDHNSNPNRFALLIAICVTLAGILLSVFVYERHPHVNDEVAYLYQARMLANGSLTLAAPPVPEAFEVYLFQYVNGRMFVVPPPGWPAMLALGVWFKVPWLINPLLGGINILLIYFVLAQIYERRIAGIAVLLLCFSPWYIFMSMNFMTHQWSTTSALVCIAGVIQARRTGKIRWAFLSGIFLGIQSLIRPLDGLILGLLIGFWIIGFGGRRLKFISLTAFAIGTLFIGSLIFPYNKYLTGDPLIYPINAYNEALFGQNANAYGFGKDHGMGWALDPFPGHGPLDAMINSQLNISQINIELFGWSTGSLLFVALFLLSRTMQRRDILLLSVLVAVFTGYFFYYFSGGPDFGARYWFLMIVPLIVFTIRGMDWLQSRMEPQGIQVFVAILVLVLFAFINYFPWRAADKYHHYLYMRPDICSFIQAPSADGDLALIQGERFPDYASAMVCNPLDFKNGSPIFAWDRSLDVRKHLLNHYKGRRVWIIQGPTLTGGNYELQPAPFNWQEAWKNIQKSPFSGKPEGTGFP